MKIFKLPDLGEGLQDAEIVEWHVKAGDEIAADQPLVSVETAKAVVEIPSPHSGRITRLFGNPGEIVRLGAPLAVFDGAGCSCRRANAAVPAAVRALLR
jgi:2-oxoisovalerate dehydrogenase E2 component (dihydrolipoyl transacylase)